MCMWCDRWRRDRNNYNILGKHLEQWSFHQMRGERPQEGQLGGKCQKYNFRLAVLRCVLHQVEMLSRQLNIWRCNLRKSLLWRYKFDDFQHVGARKLNGITAGVCVGEKERGVSNTKRLGAEEEWLKQEENKNGCLEGKWTRDMVETVMNSLILLAIQVT